jgi:xanthine dehydrogenase accessory factor
VHAPAGLDLGRTSHEEIAVAILAQLVQLRASGALADMPAPRREPRIELKLAEAIDPVCGMTVMASDAAMSAERDGISYYFCCVGCHRTFSENPGAYIKAVLR